MVFDFKIDLIFDFVIDLLFDFILDLVFEFKIVLVEYSHGPAHAVSPPPNHVTILVLILLSWWKCFNVAKFQVYDRFGDV